MEIKRLILNQRYFNHNDGTTETLLDIKGDTVLTSTKTLQLDDFTKYYELLHGVKKAHCTYPYCQCATEEEKE